MKVSIFIIFLLAANTYAAEDERPSGVYDGVYHVAKSSSREFNYDLDAVRLAHKKICSDKFSPKLNFSKEYFELHSTSYLNDNVEVIKEMSKHFSSDYKKQCQDNGYYSFGAQSCFHKCHNGFKPSTSFFANKENAKLKEMKSNCLSTCSSIRNKISNVFDSIDDFVKSDDAKSKLCNTDYRGVNNRNRAPKDDVRSISSDVDEIINSTSDK